MISSEQCRAGRALLGWSQGELCEAASIGRATLTDFESGKRTPYERTLRDIRNALEQAGVHFLKSGDVARGEGVALSTRDVSAPASQEDMDASADDARSQAAGAADSAMVGMDASKAEKASRRKRLTDAPAGTKDAVRKNGDE